MEHTKEPWEWAEHKFNAPPFEGTLDNECGIYPPDGEIGPVAIASGKNDARRIVACVNACAGVGSACERTGASNGAGGTLNGSWAASGGRGAAPAWPAAAAG